MHFRAFSCWTTANDNHQEHPTKNMEYEDEFSGTQNLSKDVKGLIKVVEIFHKDGEVLQRSPRLSGEKLKKPARQKSERGRSA